MTIGISIFLIALGAILRYATNFSVQDIEIDTVGLILMIAGIAGLILALLQEMIWADRRKRTAVVEEPPAERVYERPPRDPRY
jgi:Domain of unknown function (DUF6458)